MTDRVLTVAAAHAARLSRNERCRVRREISRRDRKRGRR